MSESFDPKLLREFARITQSVPVKLRALYTARAEQLADRYRAEPTYRESIASEAPRGDTDEQSAWRDAMLASLAQRMKQLEENVDTLARSLGVPFDGDAQWSEGETVVMSGSGVGALIPLELDVDEFVELELALIGDPTATVRAVGRVASVVASDTTRAPEPRFHLGIAFHGIHEKDRERIVRYTFARQRQLLRQHKEIADTPTAAVHDTDLVHS